MATVTGFTAPRMLEIENNTVVDGTVDENGHLILKTHGGETIDAGKVKGDKGEPGGPGAEGPAGSPNPEPVAPTSLTVVSNTGFHTPTGQPVSTVVFTWPIPIYDIIGDTPAIDGYELWSRLPSDADSSFLTASEINSVSVTTLAPGVTSLVKVRAHSYQGEWGAFSPEISVTPEVPSENIPQEPGNARVVSNVGTYRSDGRSESVIRFIWDAVTTSVDADPVSIQAYEVWFTLNGVATPVLQTAETEVSLSFPSGTLVTLKVKAMSSYGIWGDYSDSDVVTAAFPVQNNNPASIPVLTTNMGVVYSNWDGNIGGSVAGPEFQHIITETAPAPSGPWTAIGIPAVSVGNTAAIPSSPGANISVRFKWRDRLGRVASGVSPVASITVVGIEQSDFTPDLSDMITDLEKAVISVITEYAVNASETVPPSSGWSTATPARTPGTFVWMRTTTNYADGSTTVSNPVLVTGNTGSSGTPGAPGKGISSTAVTYQVHTSGTTAPTGTWLTTPQATSPGQFLWTRTITTYTDATTTTAYSVSAHGATGVNGANGAPGVGVSGTVVTYQVHTSGTVAPTGTWLSSPAATAPGQFLWTRTVTTYTDSSNSTAYSVAAHGATGAQGNTGAAGKGISSTVIEYQVGSSGTTAPTGTWVSSPPATTTGQFLWTRTTITYTDATTVPVYSVSAHGATGSAGTPGSPGAAGTDATTVNVGNDAVAIPTDPSGTTTTTHVITIPFSGWIGNVRAAATITPTGLPSGISVGSNTPATTSADGSLILNVANASTLGGTTLGEITLTVVCNSKTFVNKFSWSKVPQGATGSTGGAGPAGKGISTTVVDYQASSSGTVVPTGTWVSTPPVVSPGQYLWTRTVITYTDATSSTGYSVALQGATGSTGSAGPAGKGISTTVVTYQADASGTVVPVGTWVSSPPATTPGQYLWTRTVITYTDATSTTSYAISKHGDTGATGNTGSAGVSATSIDVGNEAVVIPCTSAGATTGASTITIPFTGFVGNTRAAATVVVSTLPTGITVQTNTPGTSGAAGSLVLAVASGSTLGGAAFGDITLTITCNSIVFVQLFTWSKGIAGATGSNGSTGAPGKGVSSVTPYYLQQGTGVPAPPAPTTNPPGGSWTITEPGYVSSTELYRAELFVFTDSTFGWTSVSKVSSYTAASQANAGVAALVARGNDLITNGNAGLGDKTNFSTWTLEKGDQPPGTAGAWYIGTSAQGAMFLDEFIPIDVSNMYLASVWAKQVNAGVSSQIYYALAPYDIDKLVISPYHYMEQPNTRTTLAAALNPGATTIQLTSAANWNNAAGANTHLRSAIFWNYVDGTGKTWPAGTYSRKSYLDIYADGGISGNVITLKVPWAGPAIPSGTAVSNTSSGGSYMYAPGITATQVPSNQTWTKFTATAVYTGIHSNNATNATTAFPIATSYVKVGLLANYTVTGGTSKQLFAGVSLSDVVAAQQAAGQAMTAANLADAAAHGMVKASQADPGHSVGRIWLVLNASNQVIGIKISNGSAWSSYILMADQILVPSSVGTVSIADGAVNAPKVNAQSIWADEAWLNVLRAGIIETEMVTPEFGDTLTLKANGSITSLISSQEVLAVEVTDATNTANEAQNLAVTAGNTATAAQSAATANASAIATVDAAQKNTATELTNVQTWFRVDAAGAHVGKSNSPFQANVEPGRFTITENGIVMTYWEAGRMVVPLAVMQAADIGNHKFEISGTGTVIKPI